MRRGENIKLKYDMHVHTNYSGDGFLKPKDLVKIALKKGLDGIAITDHGGIRGALEAMRHCPKDFTVVMGSEIMTDQGEVIGLFISEKISAASFHSVTDHIRGKGGVVVIPHPFDSLRKTALFPQKSDAKFIDLVEVYNSRCILQSYNTAAFDFASKNRLNIIAGSDAHFGNEVGKAGIEIEPGNDLRKSLLKGKVSVFGRKSFPANHAMTKAVKIIRKFSS